MLSPADFDDLFGGRDEPCRRRRRGLLPWRRHPADGLLDETLKPARNRSPRGHRRRRITDDSDD